MTRVVVKALDANNQVVPYNAAKVSFSVTGPGAVVPKQPPDPIPEVPPDQKPEAENAQWLPGYWAWDEDRKDFIWVSGFWRVPPPGPGLSVKIAGVPSQAVV